MNRKVYVYTGLANPTPKGYLSLLYQEDMHRSVRDDDEGAGKDGEPDDIFPQGENIESEGAQDGGSGYFDVQAVLAVD